MLHTDDTNYCIANNYLTHQNREAENCNFERVGEKLNDMGFFKELFGKSKFQQNDLNRMNSLKRMAQNKNCRPDEVKHGFLNELLSKNLSKSDVLEAVTMFRENKQKESTEFHMHQDDTCSALMEKWALELYNQYEHYKSLQKNFEGSTKEDLLKSVEILINKIFVKNMSEFLKSDYPLKNTELASITILDELTTLKKEIIQTTKKDNQLSKEAGHIYLEDYELSNLIDQAAQNVRKQILNV